jgi:hypothetical protein
MSDLIITPGSGKIDFIYQSGQEVSRLESIIIDPIDGLVFSGKISASSVTSPINVTATSSNLSYPFIFASSTSTGPKSLLIDSAGGTYNPSTNTATIDVSGNLTGTATTASYANALNAANSYTVVGITGNLTGTATTASYANNLNAANKYTVVGITGSLFGTSSWATNATNALQLGGTAAASYVTLTGVQNLTDKTITGTFTGNLTGTATTASYANALNSANNYTVGTITGALTGTSSWATNALTATNATQLNGQAASYYTNIPARLGYTPVNQAGDTVAGNLTVNGNFSVNGSFTAFSASNVYISSSQLYIEDNILTLNAFSPYLRYAGIEMYDSGSGTLSNLLWDGEGDYFFLSGSSVNGKIITGPDSQANLSSNFVPKATAGYKLGNSLIYDDGTYVGIGTTIPVQKLSVVGNIYLPQSNFITWNNGDAEITAVSGYNLVFRTYTGSSMTEKLRITSGGNVGIGTTGPSASLHVNSTTAGATLLRTDGTNGTLFSVVDDLSDSLMSVNNSAGLPVLEVFADDRIVAGQYGQNDFVLINNKVGIGTNNPTNKLTVSGSTSIGESYINTTSPSNGLIVQGNVGIGTTLPGAKLQVNGNVSGSSFTSSISNAVGFLGTSSWATNATNALQLGGTAAADYVTLTGTQNLTNKTITGTFTGNLTGTATTASYANALNAANNYTVGIITGNLTGTATTASYANNLNAANNYTVGTITGALTGTSSWASNATNALQLNGVAAASYVTLTGTQNLTNKTLTSPTLVTPVLGTPSSGDLTSCTFPTLNQSTTGTAATASYANALNAANKYTVVGITGSLFGTSSWATNAVTALNGGVTSIVAGTSISISGGTGAVTVNNSSPNATHTGDVTGATSLTIANDAVTTVKILNANVTNAKLANSSVTIGSTAVALGDTVTTFAGLASVTSTAFVGALTGNVTGTATTASYANALNTANNYTVNNLKVTSTVGIGTTLPQGILEVQGTTDASLAAIGSQTQLWVSDNRNQTTGVGGGISFAGEYINSNAAQITFGAIRGSKANDTSANTIGNLELYAFGGDFKFHSQYSQIIGANTVLMTLSASGNLGIGTITPSYKVQVAGDAYITNTLKNGQVETRSFKDTFSNAVANRAIDIRFPNTYLNGLIEIEVTSGYSNQNSVGVVKKIFSVGANPNNVIWNTTVARVVEAHGAAADNWTIGDFAWDATNSKYIIPIYHIVSTGNVLNITIRYFSEGALDYPNLPNTTVSAVYTATIPSAYQTRHYVYYNDNVGIGTTTPAAKLHVVGSSILANQTTINPDSYTGVVAGNIADGSGWGVTGIGLNGGAAGRTLGIGNSGTDFYFGASNGSSTASLQTYIQFNGPNRHVYLVPASGNVGIGTTSPNAKLDVNGNAIVTGSLTTTSTIVARNYIMATDTLYIQKGVGGYQSYITAEQTAAGTGNSFKFWNSGTETLMTIGYNGNVGIGTTSLNAKLVVMGEDIQNYAKSSVPTAIVADSVPEFLIGSTDNIAGEEITLRMGSVLSSYYTYGAYVKAIQGSGVDYYKLAFGTSNGAAATTKMTIANDGNVGIGTSSPGALLEISSSTAASLLNIKGTGGNGILFVSGSGNVGIGTTVTVAKLHVNSTTSGATLLRTDGTNGTLFSVVDDLSDSLMSVNNSAGLPVLEVFADDRIVAGQYGQNDFVVVNNKVGIGINNPVAKLQVTSSTSIPSAIFMGGNVGIGTTNPVGKLDVRAGSGGEIIFGSYDANYTVRVQSGDQLNFYNGASAGAAYINYAGGATVLSQNLHVEKATGGTTGLVRIKADGNLGIGTTLPTTPLHVVGVISGSSFSGAGTGLTGTAAGLSIGGTAATASYANALNAANKYTVVGITGSLFGTSSWATNAVTALNGNATHTGEVTGATALTIANDAVITARIANAAVTTLKIADANVTNAKLATDAVTDVKITNGTISNLKLANKAVTVGTTSIDLGAAATTIGGLVSVTSNAFVGPLTGNVTGTADTAASLVTVNSYTVGSLTVSTTAQLVGVKETYAGVTPASSIVTIDLNLGTVFRLTYNAAINSFTINNVTANKVNSFTLISIPAASGAGGINFTFTGYTLLWAGNITPTATTTNGKFDVFSFIFDGTRWYGFVGGLNY